MAPIELMSKSSLTSLNVSGGNILTCFIFLNKYVCSQIIIKLTTSHQGLIIHEAEHWLVSGGPKWGSTGAHSSFLPYGPMVGLSGPESDFT